jgi:6-phospho-beta-glucosidase
MTGTPPLGDCPWDDPQRRFEGHHNQFVVSARAVVHAHEIDPDNKVGCMIAGRQTTPIAVSPTMCSPHKTALNTNNFYCGDVQIRGAYPVWAKTLWEKMVSI